MQEAGNPTNERLRLAALQEYRLQDDPFIGGLDELCRLAAEICQARYSMVSIIDEQKEFVIAGTEFPVKEIAKENAIASYFLEHPKDNLVISDMRADNKWKNHPLAAGEPHIIFFAGVPLTSPGGFLLGIFYLMDIKSGTMTDKQSLFMQIISGQVERLFESRRTNLLLLSMKQEQVRQKEEYYKFAHTVTHDIKSPLSSIVLVGEMLREYFGDGIQEENEQLFGVLNRATAKIKKILEDNQPGESVK